MSDTTSMIRVRGHVDVTRPHLVGSRTGAVIVGLPLSVSGVSPFVPV
jgi:hypothetical protein